MSLIMYNKTFLSLDENLRAKKGGKDKTGETSLPLIYSPSHGPLRFFTSHSHVTRVSRPPLYEKRSAWGGGCFFFPLNNLFTGGGCCFTKSSLGTHLKYFDLSCTENSTASPCPQDTSGRYSKALSKHTAWTHARSDRSTSKQGWLFFLLFQNRVWQFSLKGSRDL